MTSEADTPESFIMQARDEDNLDRTDRQCAKGTVNHPKEHTSFEDVMQTRGTNDNEQSKNILEVGNGNNECTDGECFLYPPSVEKVAYEDVDGKSEDSAEGTSDDAKNVISKSNLQKNSNNIATEEGAEEQPAERPGPDAEGKENSDNVMSVEQELESGQNNEEEVSNIEKDNEGNSEISLEKKTEEIPLCAVDQQLEGFEIDANSESNVKNCSERTLSGNSTASPGIFEATVSEAEDKKASTAVVKGPEIMSQTENKNSQEDEDENTESSGLADISMSHTSSSPIDSNNKSFSETMKDMKELGISSWESINTVEEKKGPQGIGKNINVEEASKPLVKKDFKDTTGSSKMLKNKTGAESNNENQEEDLETDEVDQNEEYSFLSKSDSEITIEGALETAMETPEECIVKAMMNQEGRVRENLEETLTLISENTEAVETTEEISFSEQRDTKLGMENSENQRNQTDTVGAGNGDTARISQDITSEAKLIETTNFGESITSQNENDLCPGNNAETIEEGDEKIGVCTEFQPKEQENHDIEVSNEEKLDSEQASEVKKNTEFINSEGNSDEVIQSKGVDFITSMTKEEKISEVVDPEPEERQEMQNKEEFTETETQRKVCNSNLQETTIFGDAKEEGISKDDSTAVDISQQTSAEMIKQSSLEVKEADISSEDKKQYIDQNDFKSEHPPTEKGKHESMLSKEEHTDDITKNTPVSIVGGSFQNDVLENQTFKESSSGNGEGNQEIVEISPFQKEVAKIDNDSMHVIEAEATTDRQHEIQEDKDLYNINGVSADQVNSIEVQKDEKKEEIGFNEIHETESVTNEEIVNRSSGESDSCSGNQGQEIAETYRQFIEVENLVPRNDECTRISNEEIQVCEVEEEVATDTQQYSGETRDPNKTTNGVSTCVVRGVEIQQGHENSINAVEDVNQDINVESDNTEEIQDEKPQKHTNCNQDLKTEVVNNEEIMNQSSEERDACSRKQDQEDAQASTVDADNPTSSIDEYTSVYSKEVQVSDIEEEVVINKHPCTSETQNLSEDQVEISPEKENSKCPMKDMLQDTKTQSGHIEKEKDEKKNEGNFSNVIYEEVVNNEKIVNQSFKESDSCSGTGDEDIGAIAQASTPPVEAENIFPSYDECTKVASKEIRVSEIEEEIKQQSTETENPNEMPNGVMSCEVKGVEIVQENLISMNKVKNVDQVINAKSESIEVLTDEQTGSSEIHHSKEVINEEIVSLRSEESNSYSGKQDQEISQPFTPFKEAENPDLSKDDCTRIFTDEIQVTELEEEATIDRRHSFSETQIANIAKTGFCSDEIRGVEVSLVEEKLREDGNQDISAQSGSVEVQNNDKTNDKSCSNEICETEEINNTDTVNQSVEESDTCNGKEDNDTAQASTPRLEADDHVPSNDECTRISNDAILVRKIEETAAIEEQQCCPENEHTNKATNGMSTCEVKTVQIVQENQNSMDIVEAVNQDLNGDSDCIQVLQDESTHGKISFTDIYETEVVNDEEKVNQSFKKNDSSSGKEEKDFSQESIPIVEVGYSITSKDEHTSISSEEMENHELEGKATIKQHSGTRNEDLIKISSGLSCDEFTRVEIVQEYENSMKIVDVLEDVDQDINVESDNIQVPQDENTHEQTGSNASHETEEEIMNKTSDRKGSWGVKQYQESCETSTQLIEAEDLIPSKDECPGIGEVQVKEASIEKLQSRLETEESNKKGEGVHSNEVRGVETLPETENSMIIREDVNQDINVQLGSIEVENNEKTYEQTCSDQIHETEPANNEDIENRSFKDNNSCNGKQDQEISPASTLHIETEDLISSNDKGTSKDKEEAPNAKQQFSAEDEDPNKTENGVSSIEVGGMEIAQGDENFIDIVEDVNQDVCIDSETIGAQRDAKPHKETVLYEIQNRKIDIHEKAVNQSSEDQGSAKASPPLTKVDISNKDEWANTTRDEIQVNEVEEEEAVEKKRCSTKTEDECKITNGVCPFEVNEVETEQQNESHMNSEQDKDQDKNAALDSIEVQTDEETHNQTGSHMIHETKVVNNQEIVSQSAGGKQDQEIVEASKPLIEAENLVPCKGDWTLISGEEIQVTAIEEEAVDPDKTKTDVSSNKIRGVETGIENSIVVEENVDQDIYVQPDSIDLQKDERTLEQSSSNEINETQLVNNEEIMNPCSEESDSYKGKQDQETVDAFAPLTENPTSSKYECTRISSVKIQIVELEATMETADENKIKNSVSCMVKGVEIQPENESYMNKMDDVLQMEKDLKLYGDTQSNDKQCTEEDFHHVTKGDMEDDKDVNVQSNNIEVQEDEKTHEKTCFNEIHKTETLNHVIENQSSEDGHSYGEKLNQESPRASTPVIEVQNPFSSKDDCTRRISREDFQAIEEATIEKHQCSSEIEDPQELNNNDSSYKNMEPVARKEMLTCYSESIELRELNNEGNDAINRNIEDQGANSTKNLFGNSWRETNNEEISQDEGTMEKEKDTDQINKEYPTIERECKQDDSQQAIAQEKTYDEVKSTRVVQPEDERNMYDKQVPEGKETPKICKSSEIEGSLFFKENEAINQIQEKNFSDRIPNQQKPEGTESSGQNGSDQMGDSDQGQSPKISYDQTQLIELNEASGFESEVHKHEIEEPQDMNSLEDEVKRANKSISRDEMDTASKKSIHEASIAEVSSVQNVLALKLGIPKESIDGDKQEVNSGITKYIVKNIMLQKEGTSSQEFSSAVETQETDSRKTLLPKVEELDITSPKDTEDCTIIAELEQNARNVSSREASANLCTENLELDDAGGGITFPNQMAVLTICQDVKETSTAASHISQANETDEQCQAPSSKHIEQVYETTKPVAEMEETTDNSSSEKPIQETCVPEIGLRELEVPTLKDEPVEEKQELARIVQTMGEESEDLSLEFEATSSTSESKMNTEPLSYPASSSQAILNTSKVQDSKNIVEIPDVSPQFVSGKCFGPSDRVSTEFHEVIESSQQLPEPRREETEKTRHQTNSSELITEGKSLTNFEAHEATRDELKHDKIAETESLDKEQKTIMRDEQETITEISNSSIDDGTNAKDNIQGLPEHKDSKEFSQIQNMRELDTTPIKEQEQELQEIHNQLPASSLFQDSCSDVLKEESIGDKLQLQADSKEEPEEHNQIKACAQKGITIIESERIGVSSLPPNDPVKETLERAADDSSSATDGNSEQTDRNPNKTRALTIESKKNRVFSPAPIDPVKNTLESAATDDSSNATDGKSEQADKNRNKIRTHKNESERNAVTSLPTNHPVKNITERETTVDTSIITYRNSDRTDENPNKIQTHTIKSDTSYTPTKQPEIISEEVTAGKPKSDEEKDDELDETESKGPLISEELREMDLKTTQKKPHNILSGVGSKVKHSISKVKKAMTCSSSQFAPEDVIIKLNKNKKSTN